MSEPKPIALCLEHLADDPTQTYLRCVALVGRQPGLRIDAQGQVLWRDDQNVACELCVSLDQHLILLRPAQGTAVQVSRAGRSLDVPAEKPVLLLDGDEISVGAQRFRVHVHGEAPTITAPSPLVWQPPSVSKKVAAMVALGAAVAGCDERPRTDGSGHGTTSIQVRESPPTAAGVTTPVYDGGLDASVKPDGSAQSPATTAASSTATASKPASKPPIEVRARPPTTLPPKTPPPGKSGGQPPRTIQKKF